MDFLEEFKKDPNGPRSLVILIVALLVFIVPWALAKVVFAVALGVILGFLALKSVLNNHNNKDK